MRRRPEMHVDICYRESALVANGHQLYPHAACCWGSSTVGALGCGRAADRYIASCTALWSPLASKSGNQWGGQATTLSCVRPSLADL